ncbi:MAG TPA: hypothetical protein VF669_21000 [Tepidisphaeraceae bacterium]|jgi:hypothetical protein
MKRWWLGTMTLLCFGGMCAGAADPVAQKAAAERYVQFTQAAREQVLNPASCPFSPASVVLVVGNEPAKLAEFVKSKISYDPYAGVVRGAEGTLASLAGGDWDRAVLLQALLAEAGYRSRLKVVQRTPEEAGAVVDTFLNQPPAIANWFGGLNGAAEQKAREPIALLAQFGIDPGNRTLHAKRETGRVRRLVGEAMDAAAYEAPKLLAAVSSAGKVGEDFAAWRQKLIAGAGERVVVEMDRAGAPVVLSVSPEATDVDAARLAAAPVVDSPPAEKVATINLRLELTPGAEGKPAGSAVKLIDRELPVGNLFRKPIRLEIIPSDEAAAAKPAASWNKAEMYKFVSGFRNFQAILRVGEEWEGSKVFDIAGQVHNVSADGRVEGATQIGGQVGGLFGGLSGEEPKNDEPGKNGIESLVLVMELRMPGEKPRVQQRLIFGKDRADVTPVFTADMLVSAGPISTHAVTWMLLDAVTRNAPLASRLDDVERCAAV